MTTEADLTPAPLAAAGAVQHEPAPEYVWPSDPLVRQSLGHWQDLKVGVIIHWGIYTSIGQGGSWSLHREDLGWFTDPPEDWRGTDAEYHTWYYDQARTFTGEDFDAQEWASACAAAGMRYCVFTTKHHDGFCMYDSQYTNLKCTSEESGLRRDVLREVTEPSATTAWKWERTSPRRTGRARSTGTDLHQSKIASTTTASTPIRGHGTASWSSPVTRSRRS